jgi:hypothetical protein
MEPTLARVKSSARPKTKIAKKLFQESAISYYKASARNDLKQNRKWPKIVDEKRSRICYGESR